ncbi:low temperature requirement protein A [Micromonospora acroterricola]|uniref:Low temperature requirement protein A n=1 Tax=Micromonospora acroterricola TaxID=2202421 RepID=A0A317D708_9ACTN|nr:low temperature requirement protein A [Micromonospora acroterricola]PWR10661.1 low temperature requirement protein A [Micromonospora acroterricola]
MSRVRQTSWFLPAAPGSRVTRLELFYDLVFVFAFLNVTTLLAERLTPLALLGGLVVLTLLWWCWVSFASLGNALRADQGVVPLIGALTVAALLVLTLSLPEAFVDRPGGARGPLVFAVCYLFIRGLQVFSIVANQKRRATFWRLSTPVLISVTLIIIAAFVPEPARYPGADWLRLGLWAAAVGVEFVAGLRVRKVGLTVLSAGHFAERYALIVLIALGESIIALGMGTKLAASLPLTWPVVASAVFGVAVIAALWWMYFDALAQAVEQTMHRTRDPVQRVVLARDAYVYLHLLLLVGVILLALGLERYLTVIADPADNGWLAHGKGIDGSALFGGVVIYVTGLVLLRWRAVRQLRSEQLVALIVLILAVPMVARLPATVALAILALICVAAVLAELRRADPLRRQVRQNALEEQLAAEHDQSEWRRRNLRG